MNKFDFPTWLQKELDARGWSQADLARETGLSTGGVAQLMNGRRNPGPEACTSIANALDFPPETIFRIAGLLPERADFDEETEQMVHIFEQLTEEDQEAVLGLAHFLVSRRTAKGRTRPAEG